MKKKQINYKDSTKLLKDLAHYLTPSFSNGSNREIEDIQKTCQENNRGGDPDKLEKLKIE